MRNIVIVFSMIFAGSGIAGALDIAYPPLASLISGKVAVSNGGTGNTTNTQNGVLFGNGTSAIGATRQCASAEVVMGNGAAPPVCQSGPAVSSMTATGQVVIIGTATVSGNAFSVGGSTFVVSGSSVGVDTNSPAAALDVNGPAQFGAGATKSTFTTTGNLALDPAAVLLTGGASASNGTAIIRSTSTTAANPVLAVQNASGAELWQFTQAGNECLGGQLCATTMDIGGNVYTGGTLACPSSGFDLTLKCAPNNVLFNTNSLERMRVANNGNVGIGLTAPGTLLDVNGGITARGQETVTSSMTVLGTGNNVYSLTTSSGISVGAGGIVLAAGGFINLNGSVYTNPDYVFDPGYGQMSLSELRDYVSENRHLPNVPSTAEVKSHGVEIFGQNRSVLENLENAYLYIFKLNDKLERQSQEIAELKRKLGG